MTELRGHMERYELFDPSPTMRQGEIRYANGERWVPDIPDDFFETSTCRATTRSY